VNRKLGDRSSLCIDQRLHDLADEFESQSDAKEFGVWTTSAVSAAFMSA
jgi:hypothetical protein